MQDPIEKDSIAKVGKGEVTLKGLEIKKEFYSKYWEHMVKIVNKGAPNEWNADSLLFDRKFFHLRL